MIQQKIVNLISSNRTKEALQLLLSITEGRDEDSITFSNGFYTGISLGKDT